MSNLTVVVYLIGSLVGKYGIVSGYGGAIIEQMPSMEVCEQVRTDIIRSFEEDADIKRNNQHLECKTYYYNNDVQ